MPACYECLSDAAENPDRLATHGDQFGVTSRVTLTTTYGGTMSVNASPLSAEDPYDSAASNAYAATSALEPYMPSGHLYPQRLGRFAQFAMKKRARAIAYWSVTVLLGLLGLVLTALAYVWLIPRIYSWGFDPLSWRAIPSAFGLLFGVLLSWLPILPSYYLGQAAVDAVIEPEQLEDARQLQSVNQAQTELERDAEERDQDGIVEILRLSRLELDRWYTITLKQNRQSFRYAVLAMWVGFAILGVGLASAFGVTGLSDSSSAPLDIHFVVLASGTIVEFIAGLFLWIYRQSQDQFRYFYDRQMNGYGVLMAFRVANSMTEPDASKASVVETLLVHGHDRSSHPKARLRPLARRAEGAQPI